MTVAVFLGSLLGAMALGMPIAYALLLCGLALMVHLDMFDAQIIAQNLINGADSFPLMAVPFFMLAGEIMNTGGLSKRIVDVALALVGHIKGGLGYVAVLAACILSALSGSAVADAAALSALLVPVTFFMALFLFFNWLRSFWHCATMPVGRCVIRTAESVLLTCWPPAPDER